jgi:hypothetical protein
MAADQTIIGYDRQCPLKTVCRHSMAAAWLSGAAGDHEIEASFDLVGAQSYKLARNNYRS